MMKDHSFLAANARTVFGLGILVFCLVLAGATPGCERKQAKVASEQVPVIPVSKPVQRQVTDFAHFTGRTEAVQMVDIRPRVTGYLTKISFQEGTEVKAGDLLFEIDPRPFKAQLDQAVSQVTLNEAALQLAQNTYERDKAVAEVPGAVNQQQLDQDRAAVEEAQARVKAYRASTEVYKLNLEFTKVVSPIDGRISRYYLTAGNLVNQDQTLLTTVVSQDPMYAYFDLDEPTLVRVRMAINEGRVRLPQDGVIPVFMGLQDEEGYPHAGTINFVNNQVNPTTGSIAVRGVFPNPNQREEIWNLVSALGQVASPATGWLAGWTSEVRLRPLEKGTRLMTPRMAVRIRLPIGVAYPALLVIDRAVVADQGRKYVYVVDGENKVHYRRVVTGPLQEDGLRVISQGLKPDEWVVVGGLQQIRPDAIIQPEHRAMPSLAPSDQEKEPQRPRDTERIKDNK